MATSAAVVRTAPVERPRAVSAAVVIKTITVLMGIPAMLLPGSEDTPAAAIIISSVLSLVILLGLWELWRLRRWAAILVFTLTLLGVLASIPAFFDAPSGWILAYAAVSLPIDIGVLALLALPASRRAYR